MKIMLIPLFYFVLTFSLYASPVSESVCDPGQNAEQAVDLANVLNGTDLNQFVLSHSSYVSRAEVENFMSQWIAIVKNDAQKEDYRLGYEYGVQKIAIKKGCTQEFTTVDNKAEIEIYRDDVNRTLSSDVVFVKRSIRTPEVSGLDEESIRITSLLTNQSSLHQVKVNVIAQVNQSDGEIAEYEFKGCEIVDLNLEKSKVLQVGGCEASWYSVNGEKVADIKDSHKLFKIPN